MKKNAAKVLEYLQEVDGNVTAKEVAEATGLSAQSVNAIVTFSLGKIEVDGAPLVERNLPRGATKKVFVLTDAGKNYKDYKIDEE